MLAIFLHGYTMDAEDLKPMAAALGLPAVIWFPRGPVAVPGRGRSWWPVDDERRSAQLRAGARDLHAEYPRGRSGARLLLRSLIEEVRAAHPGLPLFLVGFSQGGMLACETALLEPVDVDGLALLSSSRLASADWNQGKGLENMPVFVSHGRNDPNISFSAGEELRDFLLTAHARVSWHPFDGGHEIPLPVWRELKRFLISLPAPAGPDN